MRKLILAALLLTISAAPASAQPSKRLDNPYGVTAHISRGDYSLRYKELAMMKQIGIGNVRTDFDHYTFMKKEGYQPALFDSIVACCERYDVQLLPVLNCYIWGKSAWENPQQYNTYLTYLLDRYADRLKYWEYVNEPDLYKTDASLAETARKYISTMPNAYSSVKNHGCQMLMCSLAGIRNSFWTEMLKEKSLQYADVINLHNYTNYFTPESSKESFHNLVNDTVAKYKYKHSRWLTETGYHTEGDLKSPSAFWNQILPKCFSILNVGTNATIGVVCDYEMDFYGATETDIEYLAQQGFNRIKYFTLNELDSINPSDVPVLLPCVGETFVAAKIPVLENYVRNGGTLILPSGLPFYYDKVSKSETKQVNDKYLKQFHLAFDVWWTESGKRLGVPKVPDKMEAINGFSSDYVCKYDNSYYAAKFLSDRNLQKGDTLLRIAIAGNDQYTGCVAGIFKLRSNLKGNIIFQTQRPGTNNVTETLQAKRLARSFILAFAQGFDKVFWYNFRATEKDKNYSEDNFGILHADLSPKPAFHAYATLIKMLPDKSTRPTFSQDKGLFSSKWRQPNGERVEAYWTSFGEKPVKLKLRKVKAIYDYMGNEIDKASEIIASNGVTFVLYK